MAGFTAGLISNYGLVRHFATTAEKSVGVMPVATSNDWLARLSYASAGVWGSTGRPVKPSDGVTGALAKEWWSVWNYLQYNVGGVVVGGTGDNSWQTIGVTYTPLHASTESISVFFAGGTTFSAAAAADIATKRGDCFAVVGNGLQAITQPVSASGFTHFANTFGLDGFTGLTGGNVIYVGGRKNIFLDYDGSGRTEVDKIDTASDVAANIAKTNLNANAWSVPSGFRRGGINGVISLEQNFTNNESTLLQDSGVNPVVSFTGKGSFFMGNSTGSASAASTSSRGMLNVASVLNYVRAEVKGLANEYLFEPNTESNRSQFITRANSILDGVKSSGSISNYSVICPPADNTGITFTAEIRLTPTNVAETITLRVINSTTSEIFNL